MRRGGRRDCRIAKVVMAGHATVIRAEVVGADTLARAA